MRRVPSLISLALVATAVATVARAQVNSIPSAGGTTVTQWGGINQASSAGAVVAPYNHAVTLHTTGNCCTDFAHSNNFADASFIVSGGNYRIRQTGLINSITFSWANPTTTNQYQHLYFFICRPSVSTVPTSSITDCPVIQKSADLLGSLTAGAINTVAISPAIYARQGDQYGFESVGTFGSSGAVDDRFYYENDGGTIGSGTNQTGHAYVLGTVNQITPPQAFPWQLSYGGQTDYAIPVQINMSAAPVGIVIGDSIFEGASRFQASVSNGTSSSTATDLSKNDLTSNIAYYLQRATGWTWQDMGTGSQRSDQIAARFANDCVAMHPQWCLINGGVNDIYQSGTLATFQASWTNMLTAAQAAGIKPLCMLILPDSGMNNTNSATIDTWNQWLYGQCEQYGGMTIDARMYVGAYRSGGNYDNLWNIKPEYLEVADNLQVHYSTLGYTQLAKAVLDRMGITNAFPAIQRRGQWYLKAQTQSASIGSTTIYCNTDEPGLPQTCESGLYTLHIYMSAMTAAATSTVTATVTYSDTGAPGSTNHSFTLTTSSLDLSANNEVDLTRTIVLDGTTNPTFSTTYSGTATYQVYAALVRQD